VPPRHQARGRRAENGVVLAVAMLVGTGGGLALGALLAPALVRVVGTGAAVTVPPAVQPAVLAALLGAALLGCVLLTLDDGARVRRQALTATVREDAR
jgi:hypothetical protein